MAGKQAKANFDILTAIDTNTRTIRERTCSVTGVTVAHRVWAGSSVGPLHRCWRYFTPFCIEFAGLQHPAEKVGWSVALQTLDREGHIARSMRVGIVVDAYLSEHEDINSRKITFDGYNRLPQRWALLYATSDAGKDFVNQLIGYADLASRSALSALAGQQVPAPELSTGRSGVCDGVRLLFPNSHA